MIEIDYSKMPLFDNVSETMILSQELLEKYKIAIDESKIEKNYCRNARGSYNDTGRKIAVYQENSWLWCDRTNKKLVWRCFVFCK